MNVNYFDFIKANHAKERALDDLMNQMVERFVQHKGGAGFKNTPTTVGGVQPYIHGAGGLLSPAGQDAVMYSAIANALMGLSQVLPVLKRPIVQPDQYGGDEMPLMTTIQGVTTGDLDDYSNQPENPCDDPPVAGLMKACTRTAPYGRFSGKTRQIQRDRVGQVLNRGEFTDLRVTNPATPQDPFMPQELAAAGGATWWMSEIGSRFFEAAHGWQRLLAPRLYTGSPTNNSAGGGYAEFEGLDLLINTGYVDVFTSAACPAMDSLIGSFGGTDVTAALADGRMIYDIMTDFMRYLRANARKTGLLPVVWTIVMREDLFNELCDIWPVMQYIKDLRIAATINATGTPDGAGSVNVSAQEAMSMRLNMRDNKFLPIDGIPVSVTLDDGIVEAAGDADNQYESDMYFVPLTILGGIPVTYINHFNMDNSQARMFDELLSKGQTWSSDGGMFGWAFNHKNFCAEVLWVTRPRILLHTPFIAARLEDVAYTPGIHTRSPFPSDANYYDGGRTNSPVPSVYTDWSTSTPVNPAPTG